MNSKIIELEAELKKLKEVLRSATGEEKLVIRQEITATKQLLNLWIERLPLPGKYRSNKLNLLNII